MTEFPHELASMRAFRMIEAESAKAVGTDADTICTCTRALAVMLDALIDEVAMMNIHLGKLREGE